MPFVNTGAHIGSFADLGGSLSSIEVDALDFERARVALLELAGYLDNVEGPLRVAQHIAQKDMRERFDTETAPDGREWVDLDIDYAKKKIKAVGFEHPILTRERTLREAATDDGAWTVGGDSIFFSTANLPEYWEVHQFGSDNFKDILEIDFAESDSVGGNVPPRPFIGLSNDAEEEILDTFDIWFSVGVENTAKSFAISSRGVLQTRNALGQFGPKPIIG